MFNVVPTATLYGINGMSKPDTGATHYHTKVRLPDKGLAIKWLFFICNSWDLEP